MKAMNLNKSLGKDCFFFLSKDVLCVNPQAESHLLSFQPPTTIIASQGKVGIFGNSPVLSSSDPTF